MLADVQGLDICADMVTLFSEFERKLRTSADAPCDSMQSMYVMSLKSRANWRACELQYDHSLSCKSA